MLTHVILLTHVVVLVFGICECAFWGRPPRVRFFDSCIYFLLVFESCIFHIYLILFSLPRRVRFLTLKRLLNILILSALSSTFCPFDAISGRTFDRRQFVFFPQDFLLWHKMDRFQLNNSSCPGRGQSKHGPKNSFFNIQGLDVLWGSLGLTWGKIVCSVRLGMVRTR